MGDRDNVKVPFVKTLSEAKAALDAKEAEIRRVGRAIRAASEYLSNRETWRAYRASRDRRAFYLSHRRHLEQCVLRFYICTIIECE